MARAKGDALVRLSWGALLSSAAVLLVARSSWAHKAGLSRGEYTLRGAGIVAAEIVLERGEASLAAPSADVDRSGVLEPSELVAGRQAIERDVIGQVVVAVDGEACKGALAEARAVEGDGVALSLIYRCKSDAKVLSVSFDLASRLSKGHRHIATLTAGASSRDAMAYAASPRLELPVGVAPEQGKSAPVRHARGAVEMLKLGVEHIITGYDHLLFLFGLLVVPARVKALVGVVTAFTVAHSITLTLASLGVLSLSPRVVEPAIALSIAYVGVESIFVKTGDRRWRVTFPFGLLHGLGFAGALSEIELPRDRLVPSLLLFNLGVEAGQLAALCVMLPLLYLLRRSAWFQVHGAKALGACIAVAGAVWFVLRVLDQGG